MTIACYDYLVSEDLFSYVFWSEGPQGKIKKAILFTRMSFKESFFNLSFGDLDNTGSINDLIVSNNHDAEKVLATVAKAVIAFTNVYSEALIFAKGSTQSRTRRYQMGINKFWKDIEFDFHVFGLLQDSGFEPFRSGINYTGFACKRKKK